MDPNAADDLEICVPQDHPDSLQKQCLNFVCLNLEQICVKTTIPANAEEHTHIDDELDLEISDALKVLHKRLKAKIETESKVVERLEFPDEVLLHIELSEELLKLLNDSDRINDVTMTIFDGEKTRLK